MQLSFSFFHNLLGVHFRCYNAAVVAAFSSNMRSLCRILVWFGVGLELVYGWFIVGLEWVCWGSLERVEHAVEFLWSWPRFGLRLVLVLVVLGIKKLVWVGLGSQTQVRGGLWILWGSFRVLVLPSDVIAKLNNCL